MTSDGASKKVQVGTKIAKAAVGTAAHAKREPTAPSAPKRGRGRPRAYDPAAAMAQITATFHVHGYDGTSIDDLAAAAGMNRPSIYAAFGDKKAMYLATLEQTRARVAAKLAELTAAAMSPRQKVELMLETAIDTYMQKHLGCVVVSTAATAAADDKEVAHALDSFIREFDQAATKWLDADGDPRAEAHAKLITATVHSMSIRARAGESRLMLEIMARTIVELIFADGTKV